MTLIDFGKWFYFTVWLHYMVRWNVCKKSTQAEYVRFTNATRRYPWLVEYAVTWWSPELNAVKFWRHHHFNGYTSKIVLVVGKVIKDNLYGINFRHGEISFDISSDEEADEEESSSTVVVVRAKSAIGTFHLERQVGYNHPLTGSFSMDADKFIQAE